MDWDNAQMTLKSGLTGMMAAAAFYGLAAAPGLAQENAASSQSYCDSITEPYRSTIFLAYIKSSPAQDAVAESGLKSLAARLAEKTSLEESARDNKICVKGLDIEQDDISFFPVLYWPVNGDSQPLSPEARLKVETYEKKRLGTLIFDIRDTEMQWSDAHKNVLGNVNLGMMEPMPQDHTLRKSFYAHSTLPGSLDLGPVYVQVPSNKSNEKVSRVIVGTGRNWAAAWAGMTLSPRSAAHEMAMRGGVNMVIYALTGNYKGEQTEQILQELRR